MRTQQGVGHGAALVPKASAAANAHACVLHALRVCVCAHVNACMGVHAAAAVCSRWPLRGPKATAQAMRAMTLQA